MEGVVRDGPVKEGMAQEAGSREATAREGQMQPFAMDDIVDLMREMSRQTDPQAMVNAYRTRVAGIIKMDASVSLSRRDLERPRFRVTRYSGWDGEVNPWKQRDRLPLLEGGVLADLLYGDVPRIIDDFRADPSDPGYEFIKDCRSLFAMPQYDNGVALNMTVLMQNRPRGIDHALAPTQLWMANLFGRATHHLVLREQLREAYEIVDRELRAVADIQRSLLPPVLPDCSALSLAAHYQTSTQAGGDYYDLFLLPGNKLGMLIADVSGHGTPAAVVMAITHTVAHSFPGGVAPDRPGEMLRHLNAKLTEAYSRTQAGFVTAFYGVYDPATRELVYSSAGHNPPRVRRAGGGGAKARIEALLGGRDLPLGIEAGVRYQEAVAQLRSGDTLLLYTDGITEAQNGRGEMFGEARLDETLGRRGGDVVAKRLADDESKTDAGWLVQAVLDAVEEFTGGRAATDDRTLVAARVR